MCVSWLIMDMLMIKSLIKNINSRKHGKCEIEILTNHMHSVTRQTLPLMNQSLSGAVGIRIVHALWQ